LRKPVKQKTKATAGLQKHPPLFDKIHLAISGIKFPIIKPPKGMNTNNFSGIDEIISNKRIWPLQVYQYYPL
jgi:hypothetical protein